jgi:hypothetical protein
LTAVQPLDLMPESLQARARAAAAAPRYRTVDRSERADREPEYIVWTLAGDRITLMVLSERADGSVDERTESFVLGDVTGVERDGDDIVLLVSGAEASRRVVVPRGLVSEAFGLP